MKIQATTPDEYVQKVSADKQAAFARLRQIISDNIPAGFEEVMSYGMIGYVVPKETYPTGYHCNPELPLPFINIGAQKNYIGLYHSAIYADETLKDWFVSEYPKHCKYKLDMGKSCIRFRRMEHIPFDLVKELVQKISVANWIRLYEKCRG